MEGSPVTGSMCLRSLVTLGSWLRAHEGFTVASGKYWSHEPCAQIPPPSAIWLACPSARVVAWRSRAAASPKRSSARKTLGDAGSA